MCKQIPLLANIYLIAFKIMYVIFHEFVHNHLFNQAQEAIFLSVDEVKYSIQYFCGLLILISENIS